MRDALAAICLAGAIAASAMSAFAYDNIKSENRVGLTEILFRITRMFVRNPTK